MNGYLPPPPEVTSADWRDMPERDAFRYVAETETYWSRIRESGDSVCMSVVAAVAAVSSTPPTELPPLYYEIGEDAIEALSELEVDTPAIGDASVSVTFDGYDVTVYADGVLSVTPRT